MLVIVGCSREGAVKRDHTRLYMYVVDTWRDETSIHTSIHQTRHPYIRRYIKYIHLKPQPQTLNPKPNPLSLSLFFTLNMDAYVYTSSVRLSHLSLHLRTRPAHVAACCSILQRVAACGSMLQHVAACCGMNVAACGSTLVACGRGW